MKTPHPVSAASHSLLEKYRMEISRCVKCGSCSAVCPSYLHERSESFSARGRIAMVKAVLDGRLAMSEIFKDRLATCTTCLACDASCASGVRVTEIIQAAKEQAVEESGTGLITTIITRVLKSDQALRSAAWFAPALLHYAGKSLKGRGASSAVGVRGSEKHEARRAKKTTPGGRVVFFPGCAVKHFQPDIGFSATAVLNAAGYDVIIPGGLQCCGRPLLSLGDRKAAEELAVRNSALLTGIEAEAVVTACASCGLTFKREYPKLLPPGAKRPIVLDIHEFLATRLGGIRLGPVTQSITVHDPCHLGRGQGLSKVVRDMLRAVPGLSLVEMKDADRCCGFGGLMRVTDHSLSDGIAEEKVRSIIATGASAVAAGCPGCRMQMTHALRRAGADVEVLHPVQVIERALSNTD